MGEEGTDRGLVGARGPRIPVVTDGARGAGEKMGTLDTGAYSLIFARLFPHLQCPARVSGRFFVERMARPHPPTAAQCFSINLNVPAKLVAFYNTLSALSTRAHTALSKCRRFPIGSHLVPPHVHVPCLALLPAFHLCRWKRTHPLTAPQSHVKIRASWSLATYIEASTRAPADQTATAQSPPSTVGTRMSREALIDPHDDSALSMEGIVKPSRYHPILWVPSL